MTEFATGFAPHAFETHTNVRFKSCGYCGRLPEHSLHAVPEDLAPATDTNIEVTSGLYFDFSAPTMDMVVLEDIARSLSMTVRFRGHVSRWYSVAEHGVRVAMEVSQATGGRASGDLLLAALHHDSHEAFTGDIPKPMKRFLGAAKIAEIESAFDIVIGHALGVNPELMHHPAVKAADAKLLYREAATLTVSRGVGKHWGTIDPAEPLNDLAGWGWQAAELTFLRRHRELTSW